MTVVSKEQFKEVLNFLVDREIIPPEETALIELDSDIDELYDGYVLDSGESDEEETAEDSEAEG